MSEKNKLNINHNTEETRVKLLFTILFVIINFKTSLEVTPPLLMKNPNASDNHLTMSIKKRNDIPSNNQFRSG